MLGLKKQNNTKKKPECNKKYPLDNLDNKNLENRQTRSVYTYDDHILIKMADYKIGADS